MGKQSSQPELTEHDVDLVTVVAEDLRFLARPVQDQVTRTDVRLIATVLRRLLLHGDYSTAWRLMGNEGEPSLRAMDPEPMVRDVPDPMWIHYAYAGGSSPSRARHAGLSMVIVPAAEHKGREAFGSTAWDDLRIRHSVRRTYKLTAYKRSTCIQIASNKIKRQDLLHYVAKQTGWSPSRPATLVRTRSDAIHPAGPRTVDRRWPSRSVL